MADTLISVDLSESPHTNDKVHNRWHPDIPIAVWVEPGDDFKIETYDWTGGQIANDDEAADVRDVELEQVHYLSGPIGVKGAEPGDLLKVHILDIGANVGLLTVSFLVLRPAGSRTALALAITSSQRNMGLILAVAGATLPETVWLYVAMGQFPIYFAAMVLKRVAGLLKESD